MMNNPQAIDESSNWKIPFFTIWTGQAFSILGSNLVQFALVWWLTSKTGSATVLATSTLFAMLPTVFLGPFVGTLVDRFNRRFLIMVSDGIIALLTILLMYLFWSGLVQTYHIYAILFFRSLVGEFHWPSFRASTSLMVPKDYLGRLSGLNQALHGALSIAAPPLGALLLGLLPLHSVLFVDVITAGLAILPLFFFRIPQPARLPHQSGAGAVKTMVTDFREGLRYVIAWRGLMSVLIISALINFFVNPGFTLLPLMVTEHFGKGVVELGWMESATGIGIILGGLILGFWGGFRRKIVTALIAVIGMGLGMFIMAAAPGNAFWMGVIGITITGVMSSFANGPTSAILQANVKPEIQGRVMTLTGSTSMGMMPLSMLVAGPLSDLFGIPFWYGLGGVACLAMGVIGLLTPVIVHIEDNHGIDHPITITDTVPVPTAMSDD